MEVFCCRTAPKVKSPLEQRRGFGGRRGDLFSPDRRVSGKRRGFFVLPSQVLFGTAAHQLCGWPFVVLIRSTSNGVALSASWFNDDACLDCLLSLHPGLARTHADLCR